MSSSFPEIDNFLCRILRGEKPAWPRDGLVDFGQALIDRSIHHGVQLLVFDFLHHTAAWRDWPAMVRDRLSIEHRSAAAQEMVRSHCVPALLEMLRGKGIDALVTKGEALARKLYAKPFLRARCDTDLFIDLKDIDRVRTTLLESGYKVIPPIYKSHQFTGIRQFAGARIAFDVHWRILNEPRFARTIRFAEAAEHSVPIPGLPEARTLNVEDSLMLACMHREGSHIQERGRLIWLYDIHLLSEKMTAEQWNRFTGKAVGLGVHGVSKAGLEDSRACFMTQIPDDVIRKLAQAPMLTFSQRLATSNLSLLVDDMKCLPNREARQRLIGELFLPSGGSLLRKYKKKKPLWVPLLYLHQVFGGVMKRLTLR